MPKLTMDVYDAIVAKYRKGVEDDRPRLAEGAQALIAIMLEEGCDEDCARTLTARLLDGQF